MGLSIKLVLAILPLLFGTVDLSSDFQQVLDRNIQSFWLSHGLDEEYGGYLISYDREGQLVLPVRKSLVTQARQLWLHSRLARRGMRREENLRAARLGFRFLTEKMWDPKFGGFYWEVDRDGTPLKTYKHVYGQAFALYALSEYQLAEPESSASAKAQELFGLLEAKAHDPLHPGYLESFDREWRPISDPRMALAPGSESSTKLQNTHLHLLEAMTNYYRASGSPAARRRIEELIGIMTQETIRKNLPAASDAHSRDWSPRLSSDTTISYGHNLETIWLVLDACRSANLDCEKYRGLFEGIFNYCAKYGFDSIKGGFYEAGPPNQDATKRNKVWWVQAEAMVSSLWMYRWTGKPEYLLYFFETWRLVRENMIDWKHGEWHAILGEDGRISGAKADAWKAGYHDGRSMMEAVDFLTGGLPSLTSSSDPKEMESL